MTTLPVPNFLRSAEIVGLLVANGLAAQTKSDLPFAAPLNRGEPYPSTPNRQYLVTGYDGTGFSCERALDTQKFQLISRGRAAAGSATASLAAADAEQMAWNADAFLMDLGPGMIGAQYVNNVDRVAGGPSFFERDSARRVLFVCSYQFMVARTNA